MIRKTASPTPGHVRIVFELPSSVWAHRVSLLGEFNHWQEEVNCLTQDKDGQWRVIVDLPAGHHYEFCYLVDGHYLVDVRADGLSLGGYGEQRSIVYTSLDKEVGVHRNDYELQIASNHTGYQTMGSHTTNRHAVEVQ